MNKLELEQAIVVMGYTGYTACKFSHFHADVERRLGHPVFTHEFANPDFEKKLQELYREDFIKMCNTDN